MRADTPADFKRRVAVAAVVAIASVVAFASLGGVGLAKNAVALAQYQYGKNTSSQAGKVTICHKGKTITVSLKAWPAHQRHGDGQGTCATLKAKKNKGKHKGASHHAPNPGSGTTGGSGPTTTTSTTTGSSEGHGNGKGHNK